MEDIKAPEVSEEEFMLDHGHVGCTRSLQAWKLGTNPPFGMIEERPFGLSENRVPPKCHVFFHHLPLQMAAGILNVLGLN